MKKKVLFGVLMVVVMAFIVLTISVTAKAEEFVITGYGVGETAVKGDIEKQAKIMIESWGNKKPAKIIIQGFADITGKAAENDAIARDRAREMEAFIIENVNADKITARSKGDSENARKVVVVVEFAAPVAVVTVIPDSQAEKIFYIFLSAMLAVAAVIVIIMIIRLVRSRKALKVAKQLEVEARSRITPQSLVSISSWPVKITINGKAYNFFPETAEDGRFKTFYEIEHGNFMFVSGEKELKKSLKSSFKQDRKLLGKLLSQEDKNQPRLVPAS